MHGHGSHPREGWASASTAPEGDKMIRELSASIHKLSRTAGAAQGRRACNRGPRGGWVGKSIGIGLRRAQRGGESSRVALTSFQPCVYAKPALSWVKS
jgi:hypothetical protein